MEDHRDRQAEAETKNRRRRRKKGRLYTVLACRRDDPSDLYGVMFRFPSRKNGQTKVIAMKGRCVFSRAIFDPSEPGAFQKKWNDVSKFVRRVKSRGRDRKFVRHVSRPPALPRFPGTCYTAAKTDVVHLYDRVYFGRIENKKIYTKRMPLEDFRFFTTRIGSKNCPLEFSEKDRRTLEALAHGRRGFDRPDQVCLEFSVKKNFNFKWGGRAEASAGLSRRDHEPGPVESGAQAAFHTPVNPVARAVNVLRSPGVQNSGTDEMRKGEGPKRSGGEGDARARDRNSESAALSGVSVSGTRLSGRPARSAVNPAEAE